MVSPVSAIELRQASMLVDRDGLPCRWLLIVGADLPHRSVTVLQAHMVFCIGKLHKIGFRILTDTAVEHLDGC